MFKTDNRRLESWLSVVQSAFCSCGGPRFSSQHPPVPEDPTPSSVSEKPCTHTVPIYVVRHQCPYEIMNKQILKIQDRYCKVLKVACSLRL